MIQYVKGRPATRRAVGTPDCLEEASGGWDGFFWLLGIMEALGCFIEPPVRIWMESLSGTLICWAVQRIFHGHFPTPKAVPLGGALEVDIIQTVDNPSGPDKP